KFGDLGAIERGIQQLTLQARDAREEAAATAERVARKVAADMADAVPRGGADVTELKRDLESLHVTHVESEQRTHETLEAVHDTLARLVERLATIDTAPQTAPQADARPPSASPHPKPRWRRSSVMPRWRSPARRTSSQPRAAPRRLRRAKAARSKPRARNASAIRRQPA